MNQTISVIQITTRQLLAVEVRQGRSGFELLHYLDLPLPEAGLTPEWFKEIWSEGHFETNRVVNVLAPEMVKYKTLQLPPLAGEQLAAAVRLEYEAKHEIYQIIEEKRIDQGVYIKTANVDVDGLNASIQCLEAAGLNVLWSGLRFQGLYSFLNFHRNFLDNSENQLYLDIQEEMTEVGCVNGSETLFRRSIALGRRHFQSVSSDWVEDLLEELRLSLVAVSKIIGELPPQIGLFGQASAELLPLNRMETELQAPCYLPEKTRLTGILTGIHTPHLAALIGIALDELGWDPHPERRFQTTAQIRKAAGQNRLSIFLKAGVMVALMIFGLLLGMRGQTIKTSKDNAWIAQNLAKTIHLKQLNAATQKNIATIDSLEGWLEGRGVELEFLRILQSSLPEATLIDDLTIEDQKLKNLSGSTPSVSNMLHRFQQIPTLKGLKLKGSITNTKDGREQFQMEGTIELKESVR